MNERYRAPTILVAIVEGDKDIGALTCRRHSLRHPDRRAQRDPQDRVDGDQLADAAKKVHAQVEDEWSSIATVRRDSQDAIDVLVPIRALGDWVQVRQRLGARAGHQVRDGAHARRPSAPSFASSISAPPSELQQTLMQAGLLLARTPTSGVCSRVDRTIP